MLRGSSTNRRSGVGTPAPPTPQAPSGGGGGPVAPAQHGPWFATNSPWRTPIPHDAASSATGLDWTHYIHPDTAGMVGGAYIGTTYSSMDVHSFGYDLTDMTTKWGSNGATYMKWLGPGPFVNVVYTKSTDPTTRIYMDYPSYKAAYIDVPGFPNNWTGYNSPPANHSGYLERRTQIICDDGRSWYLYQETPPGITPYNGGAADGYWHATTATPVNNWTDINFEMGPYPGNGGIGGGSGICSGAGVILPYDFINVQPGGWLNHALSLNAPSAADGSYVGANGTHYSGVWPSFKGYPANVAPGAPAAPQAGKGDGVTKTICGIPHGARIFLDPSLTDSDLRALGCTKEWMLVIARTFQRYGAMTVESTAGLGDAGGILCESNTSIAWNAAQGVPGYGTSANPYQFPWVADGTADNDGGNIDGTYYNSAFPAALVPGVGVSGTSHWKIFDWRSAYPGISLPA